MYILEHTHLVVHCIVCIYVLHVVDRLSVYRRICIIYCNFLYTLEQTIENKEAWIELNWSRHFKPIVIHHVRADQTTNPPLSLPISTIETRGYCKSCRAWNGNVHIISLFCTTNRLQNAKIIQKFPSSVLVLWRPCMN